METAFLPIATIANALNDPYYTEATKKTREFLLLFSITYLHIITKEHRQLYPCHTQGYIFRISSIYLVRNLYNN